MTGERLGPRKKTPDAVRVVRLTPPGRGAVAVVLVEGPQATELVADCFAAHRGRPLTSIPLGRIAVGRWGGPDGEELIVCRRTPDSVEVHPHGGEAAVENVVESLVQRGAVEISWQAWVAARHECPLRAAAQRALAEAPTQRTAKILLDQFAGALRRDLEHALDAIEQGAHAAARAILDGLRQRSDCGLHLARPWHVVLAGPPNVGKSSLINVLVGYERSIVYDQPGTTRDVVVASTAVAGWPVELSDTAGLRESDDPLEAAGVRLAEEVLAAADAVIFVLDATACPAEVLEAQIPARAPAHRRTLIAINKVDLLDAPQRALVQRKTSVGVHVTSAATREGIDGLIDALAALLVPSPPTAGDAIPFEPRQCEQINAAIESLDAGDGITAAKKLQSLLRPDTARR